jgi:hypothetical protein
MLGGIALKAAKLIVEADVLCSVLLQVSSIVVILATLTLIYTRLYLLSFFPFAPDCPLDPEYTATRQGGVSFL